MNFITYWKAYALYPVATFDEYVGIVTDSTVGSVPVSKYTRRGWSMLQKNDIMTDRICLNEMQHRFRYVGDKFSRVIVIVEDTARGDVEEMERTSWKHDIHLLMENDYSAYRGRKLTTSQERRYYGRC